MRHDFLINEEADRLNPDNILLRIIFLSDGPDGKGRRIYAFFVNRGGTIKDLKTLIKRDFGYETHQTALYFRYQELESHDKLIHIPDFDIEQDILMMIAKERPNIHLNVFFREKLDDIKMSDVKFFNCHDGA